MIRLTEMDNRYFRKNPHKGFWPRFRHWLSGRLMTLGRRISPEGPLLTMERLSGYDRAHPWFCPARFIMVFKKERIHSRDLELMIRGAAYHQKIFSYQDTISGMAIGHKASSPGNRRALRKKTVSLFKKQGGKCHFCGFMCRDVHDSKKKIDLVRQMTVDHLVPKSQGGSDQYDNLVGSCTVCNSLKSDMDLEEFVKEAPWKDGARRNIAYVARRELIRSLESS